MPEPKLSYDLLESRIPFFDFVQRVVDKGSVPTEVFSGILKIFTRIYSVDINPNDISIKERSKEAIEFIMTLFDSEDSPFIKDIAHSLSNIISTFGDLAQIVIDKSIGSIRWLMANANFATRSAITWLFLTLMANEQSFVLIDDIEMVIAIAESQRQTDFVKHVIKSFEYVFDIQERDPKREGRSIENYFEECDGYDLIASFEEIDDEEIQKMIQKFGDKYNDTKLELDLVQSTEEEEMHMF
ncbi:hypothetical protein GPJ56_002278 [Histomonas meleagridis]|uniref:uncharacterized protein n=1 Tax=Histomonas meleagridis TaxID=135588 RepID=UPI00355960F4|nr:hypothetical protein GPJ56_002278 [Histomonas meleagridis]KAH0802970.1 hypothetical protein GO595_004477 [Histomonas meleagridis]